MLIEYLDRKSYRNKYNQELIQKLKIKYGDFYLIPEGGTNKLAVQGCAEMLQNIDIEFDFICTPCGTGGTLAGLILGLDSKSYAIGFSVLKGGDFLNDNVRNLLKPYQKENLNNWKINLDYHFGGYAKINKELITFCNGFNNKYDISIEPIYTGKMFYGIFNMIKDHFFPAYTRIVAIHTGGLQGLKGLNSRNLL